MADELTIKILQAKENIVLKERLNRRLQLVMEKYNSEKDRLEQLSEKLLKEEKDVTRLETLSITGLFYTILGSKENQIEKERQEYLQAKLKYNECIHSIESHHVEIVELNNTLENYKTIDLEYQELMKEKENVILLANNQQSSELHHLIEVLSETKANLKEIKEAYDVSLQVKHSLEKVLSSLDSAKGWGMWDMFGGGIIATAAKHSYIDDAQQNANEVQSLLRRLERELQDIHLNSNISMDIGSFTKFADYFFDGLISDWIVQSKINNSHETTSDIHRKVLDVIGLLKIKQHESEIAIQNLENKITLLIEMA